MLCSWMALHQKGRSIRHFATFLSVLCTLFLIDISRRSERQVTTAVVGLLSAEACPASSVRSHDSGNPPNSKATLPAVSLI